MGMEAICRCRWSGGEAQVKALLEARDLILRGDLKRILAISTLKSVTSDGDDLLVTADEPYVLTLGAARAARWKAKIEAPPPTLAAKLGLRDGVAVHVIGSLHDTDLRAAIDGAQGPAAVAKICIAEIDSEAALLTALDAYARDAASQPLWIVHGKGPKAAFGDGPVRTLMRARGFVDSKSCAVSADRSATRYGRR